MNPISGRYESNPKKDMNPISWRYDSIPKKI